MRRPSRSKKRDGRSLLPNTQAWCGYAGKCIQIPLYRTVTLLERAFLVQICVRFASDLSVFLMTSNDGGGKSLQTHNTPLYVTYLYTAVFSTIIMLLHFFCHGWPYIPSLPLIVRNLDKKSIMIFIFTPVRYAMMACAPICKSSMFTVWCVTLILLSWGGNNVLLQHEEKNASKLLIQHWCNNA